MTALNGTNPELFGSTLTPGRDTLSVAVAERDVGCCVVVTLAVFEIWVTPCPSGLLTVAWKVRMRLVPGGIVRAFVGTRTLGLSTGSEHWLAPALLPLQMIVAVPVTAEKSIPWTQAAQFPPPERRRSMATWVFVLYLAQKIGFG